ncbi:MAG: hypothetical protein SXV54_13735 [Chloroflexota bacterium]|nr:hypothetical protein [Chloroflexota bacterium]
MRTITVTLDDRLDRFVKQQAEGQRISPAQAVEEMVLIGFETRLEQLYSRYSRGEYSLGRLAKELGLTTWEVVHLLEERGWATHNLPTAPRHQAL